MKDNKWWHLLNPPKDYNYTDGEDFADSIGLILICALVVCVVLFL